MVSGTLSLERPAAYHPNQVRSCLGLFGVRLDYTHQVFRVYTAVVLTEIVVVTALWALGVYFG